jgi:carboxypeptidase family protein/TonB-dependent receptor-like protein
MLRNPGSARSAVLRLGFLVGAIAVLLAFSPALRAQTGSTGNIAGTVTGPRGNSVSGAAVTVTNKLTGESFHTTTSPAGTYTFRDLVSADYVLHVDAKGFRTAELLLRIQAGATATGDVKLQRLVAAGASLVNTENPAVESVVTASQLDQLPTNRNFLELVNLEPGVQLVDGLALAPSKSGTSSVSIDGRDGRTTRMSADGVDITDETVGATTQNLAVSSIQELQIGQTNLAGASALTGAGAVNAVTKSGANDLHGQVFGNFRDKAAGVANFPGGQDNSYSREVFGGSVGGALEKDKLFFFLAGEYFKQDLMAPVVFNAPFSALSGKYRSPFRETELDGRLDYRLSGGSRLFYRFIYDNNSATNSVSENNFQLFKNHGHTPGHAVGFDFNSGSYAHSLRFGYNRFSNSIADAVEGSNIFNPAPGISLNFGGGSGFASGPNSLAPQRTIQANKEANYDGSRTWQTHTFHYGFGLNRIDNLVFSNLFGLAAQVGADTGAASTAVAAALPGGVSNPLNYPVDSITLGNNFGCFSGKSAFGSPCGGWGDTRIQLYWGDQWKARPNLTVSYGVSYVRDTGRTDSDLPAIPCSAVASYFSPFAPCSGSASLLNQFGFVPGIGNKIRQPNLNFAPRFGVAWDPRKSGRTVIRAGVGLYYDGSELNNVLFDRVVRSAKGTFNAHANDPCASPGVVVFPNDVLHHAMGLCGQPVGSVTPAIATLQSQFQLANAGLGANSANPNYLGQLLSSQQGILAPNFQTPRTVQMNIGIEHQVRQGTVFGLSYARNVSTHYLLGRDTNHVGDANFLNTNAALKAITATVMPVGCPAATSAGANSQAAVTCYLANVARPSIVDFARHGLDSGGQYLAGFPAALFQLNPTDTTAASGAAFAGANPLVGRNIMFFPAGRSVYSGLQFSMRSQINNPVRKVQSMNLLLSYAHSTFKSNVAGGIGDQDLTPLAADFNHPTKLFGSASQDRKHQLSLATILQLPFSARLSFIGRFDSPLPQTLFLPASGGVPGEIFRTDVSGDGAFGGQSVTGNSSFGDIVPGTNIGSFGRSITAGNLNNAIQTYNASNAGKLTPAGNALLTANLFTASQLSVLHAVTPLLQTAPPGNVDLGWLRSFDTALAWPLKIREGLVLEPRVSVFNVFNFANFDAPNNTLVGILGGQPGQVNGTAGQGAVLNGIQAGRAANRIGVGSGIFTLGAPRQMEFGLKITF